MQEKVINRIRKMLALANDLAATEHERDTALKMAYNTMAKHNLAMHDLTEAQETRDMFDTQNFSFPFARRIAGSMATLFMCDVIIGEKINGTQCKYYFVGLESNAATCMVMTDFVIKSIMKEGRRLYKQNTSTECRSFCQGAASKLSARVTQMLIDEVARKNTESSSMTVGGLVLFDLRQIERSANSNFDTGFSTTMKKQKKTTVNTNAYDQGQTFGASINLNLQVGHGQETKPLMIGN